MRGNKSKEYAQFSLQIKNNTTRGHTDDAKTVNILEEVIFLNTDSFTRERINMPSARLFQTIGGLASIGSGFLLASAHVINLLSGVDSGTVLGKSFVLIAHLGLVFAFIGLYEAQGKSNRLLGLLGMVLGTIGTIFVTAVVFVEVAAAAGTNVTSIFKEGITAIIYLVGPFFFVFGMILFGISVMKEGILPPFGGLCLLIGTVIFSMASVILSMEGILTVIGGAITGIGFVWLGGSLLLSMENSERLSRGNDRFI